MNPRFVVEPETEGTVGLGEFTTFPQPPSPPLEDDQPRFVEIDEHTGLELPILRAGDPPGVLETIRNYLGIRQPKTTPLEIEAIEKGVSPYQIRKEIVGPGAANIEEIRRVVGRGFSGLTGGVADLVKGYSEDPETWPGAVTGAGAELVGFLVGPYKSAKLITGSRLAPTARGLRGVAQVMTEGGANLGLASALSSAVPSLMESDSLTEFTNDVAESAAMGALVGMLFPAMGAVPTRPLRVAVSLAVMDKVRAGAQQWFTIDDVIRGVKDGTIDSKALGEAAFSYLMDIYFTLKVPSMKKQLAGLDNAALREIASLNVTEAENTIVGMGRRGDIEPEPTEGITRHDLLRQYGGEQGFNDTFSRTRPIGGAAPPSPSDPMLVEAMFNKADSELSSLRSSSLKKVRQNLARAFLDTSAEVKKQLLEQGGDLGKEAVIHHDLVRGMSAKSDAIYAEAEKDIWGGLDKVETKLLDRMIQSRRTIAIDKHRAKVMLQAIQRALTGEAGLQEALDDVALLRGQAQRIEARADTALKQSILLEGQEKERARVVGQKVVQAENSVERAKRKVGSLKESLQSIRDIELLRDEARRISHREEAAATQAVKHEAVEKERARIATQAVREASVAVTKAKKAQDRASAQRHLTRTQERANLAWTEANRAAEKSVEAKRLQQLSFDKLLEAQRNMDNASGERQRIEADLQASESRLQESIALSEETNIEAKRLWAHAETVAREAEKLKKAHTASFLALDNARKAEDSFHNQAIELFGATKEAKESVDRAREEARRSRERLKEASEKIEHPGELGQAQHESYLDSLKTSSPETYAKLNERSDKYFAEWRKQLIALKDAGLISAESFTALDSVGDYSPRRFIQHMDPDRQYSFGGRTISVPDSGIKKLDTGSTRAMENNARLLLSDGIARTQRRIGRNKANVALLHLAEQVPENPVVKKLGPKESAPSESETIRVVIDGKQVRMSMPRDLAQQWVESDPAINAQMANIIGWASGSKILKPMATGLNPEFALTNMPRDMIHVWLTTHEYSPHFPVFAGQLSKDYAKTAKDAIFRTGAYADYINEGGGMTFLTHQGRITSATQGVWSDIQRVLGYLGETSEIWTRLALRNRAITNEKPGYEATWVARNYLDFSQGGWATKGVDTSVPYLNAAVQATRTVFRAGKERPGETIWKFAQLASIASGLYLANRLSNEEAWNAIPPREKVNNFIITTPLSYIDAEGNKRWLYFTVPKDQSQRVITTVFENLMAKQLGDPVDADQITQAVQDFIPIMPSEVLPPTLSAMLGYYANKDFWRNEDLWKGPAVTAREEYTKYTHPALVEFGQATGMSPERTAFVLKEFFTSGNIYTTAVGAGMGQIMQDQGKEGREQITEDMLRAVPFLRRTLKATQPYEPFRKQIEDVKLEDQTRTFVIQRDLDVLSEKFWRAKKQDKDAGGADRAVRQFIGQQSPQLHESLIGRHLFMGQVFEIPDRRFWMSLHAMSAEARAVVFWTRWMQGNEKEKKALMERAASIKGMVTGRFSLQFDKLKTAAARFEPE